MMDGEDPVVSETQPALDFPVIGIGASAGGLEAVTTMFHEVEQGTGMAFVLVMHLDPDHESLMAELLSRKTHIQVRQIADNDVIEVDCLHVIPPGSSLQIENNRFRLEPFSEPRGLRRPIDLFFKSLAELQGEKCASVVLSGTGADGSAGLRVIKEMGGVAAVQAPDEARYDGMPFAAISTNLVDFTLPAVDIVPRLKSFFEGGNQFDYLGDESDRDVALQNIFGIMQQSMGNDFSGYKKSTLLRRLQRRMQVLEFTDMKAYVEFLDDNYEEKVALGQDFLINVTSFFRDRENFEIMRKSVLLPLIERAEPSDEVRIWVPGCSSGQEAYTIAMMVDETCEELRKRPLIQIFATDIDEEMITVARRAHYPVSVFTELPKRYQDRYTIGLDGKFEVVSKIREMVRFSVHNLIQDPPFSKIDLISCRNVLIYFGEELQANLFPLLHFSLAPAGHLFLGTSENVTRRGELFAPVDQRARVFKKRNVARRPRIQFPLSSTVRDSGGMKQTRQLTQEVDFPRHQSLDATNANIYEQYSPPFLRVAHDGRIIDSSGDLSLFVMSRPGEDRSLHSLARDGVRDVVMPLLVDAVSQETRQALKDVEVSSPFGTVTADIIAHPMKDETVALIFLLKDRLQPIVDEFAVTPVSRDRRVSDLQEELQGTRLLLKSKVEEIETANEELKSSNEEMMSMNEELQSANEELTTANEELKNKIDELTLANADLDNFLNSSDFSMIVLDRGLRIRHVTDAARRVVPIQQSDTGRALQEFNIDLPGIELVKEIHNVMAARQVFTASTTPAETGNCYFVRISPYFFPDNRVDGVSISLVDISNEARLRKELLEESKRLKTAMQAARMGLAELDVETGEVTIDDVLAKQFLLDGAGNVSLEQFFANFVESDRDLMNEVLSAAIEQGEEYEIDFRILNPDDREDVKWIRTRGQPYIASDGRKKVVGPTLDITDENAIERREMLIREMSHRVKNLFGVIASIVLIGKKSHPGSGDFADELLRKISALGRTYDLARKSPDLDGVRLHELVHSICKPHVTTQSFAMDGPETPVDRSCLNTIALVLHELATNAVKYGALRYPNGELKISWREVEGGVTFIDWHENVPDIELSSHKEGFGTSLLKASMKQLKGSFEREFSKNGIHVTLGVSLSLHT